MAARVSRTYERPACHLQVLNVRDAEGTDQTLRVTEEHPFFVARRGWTKAREVAGGDVLLEAAGEASAVLSNLGEAHLVGLTVYSMFSSVPSPSWGSSASYWVSHRHVKCISEADA